MNEDKIIIHPEIGMTMHIACFPGIGEHKFYNENILSNSKLTALNYICRDFPWVDDKERRKDMIRMSGSDYEESLSSIIKKIYGSINIIMIPAYPNILKAMAEKSIPNLIVLYPCADDMLTYFKAYKEEGCSKEFIEVMTHNWVRYLIGVREIVSRNSDNMVGIELLHDETIQDIIEIYNC